MVSISILRFRFNSDLFEKTRRIYLCEMRRTLAFYFILGTIKHIYTYVPAAAYGHYPLCVSRNDPSAVTISFETTKYPVSRCRGQDLSAPVQCQETPDTSYLILASIHKEKKALLSFMRVVELYRTFVDKIRNGEFKRETRTITLHEADKRRHHLEVQERI